jgi:hypothetical protein
LDVHSLGTGLMSETKDAMMLPARWGDDPLSSFMSDAFRNLLATFVQKPQEYGRINAVAKCFAALSGNLGDNPEVLPSLFLTRAHSAFLGACRMSVSGQVTETFPLLRSCLEYSLYALHVSGNLNLAEMWIQRHVDEVSMKKCKKSFMHSSVIQTLEKKDAPLRRVISRLYEETIDFGAHPNERALSSNLRMHEYEGMEIFRLTYLQGNSSALAHALLFTAQTGLGALLVFEHVFRDRMGSLGVDVQLEQLRQIL